MRTHSLTACLVLTLALAGCGDKAAEAPQGDTGAGGTAATRSASDAVAAVQASEGQPVARVAFVIGAKPVAGKAFPLQLRFTAAETLPALQVAAEAANLIISPATAVVAVAAGDTPATLDVVVTAPKEGLAELTLRLKADAEGAETVYQIPVLVAAP